MPAVATRRRLDPEARRGEIVAAARRLFAEHSVGTVTTADVADAAGVARSLVHHYFGGIHDLFLVVAAEGAAALSNVRQHGPGTPVPERWQRNVAATLDVIAANRETWLTVMGRTGADIQALAAEATRQSVERALAVNADLIEDTPATRLALRGMHAFSTEVVRAWLTGQATRAEVEPLLVATLSDVIGRLSEAPRTPRTPRR